MLKCPTAGPEPHAIARWSSKNLNPIQLSFHNQKNYDRKTINLKRKTVVKLTKRMQTHLMQHTVFSGLYVTVFHISFEGSDM